MTVINDRKMYGQGDKVMIKPGWHYWPRNTTCPPVTVAKPTPATVMVDNRLPYGESDILLVYVNGLACCTYGAGLEPVEPTNTRRT